MKRAFCSVIFIILTHPCAAQWVPLDKKFGIDNTIALFVYDSKLFSAGPNVDVSYYDTTLFLIGGLRTQGLIHKIRVT